MTDTDLHTILGDDEMFLLEESELNSQVSDGQLSSVQALGDRMLRLDNLADRVEDVLKKVKEAKRQIAEDMLPKKMMEVGLSSFSLVTGETISIENVVAANMPKASDSPDLFEKAINWLDTNGVGDIVKKDVTAKFGRGEGEMAKRVFDAIVQATNGQAPVEMKESVNYMTLNSVLKQRMRAGEPLPTVDDGFSIYVGPRAKIAKAKKGR